MKVPVLGTRKIFYGWIIVMASACVTCTGFGILYSFSVFFKSWIREWANPRAALSAVFSLAFITYGLVSIAMGWLTDRYGPRRIGVSLRSDGIVQVCLYFLCRLHGYGHRPCGGGQKDSMNDRNCHSLRQVPDVI